MMPVDVRRTRYGDHPSQWVELSLPDAPAPPVAILVHGGFWKAAYGAEYARPLVPSLLAQGWATAVVEYRRVGAGGGWPATLADVAAAVDLLADVTDVDRGRVVVVGHSAGAQLAAWLAARAGLPDGVVGSGPRVRPRAVVAQAGVLDLRAAARDDLGHGATVAFLGGAPDAVGDRYDLASPVERLPLGVPMLCVHPADDADVPLAQTRAYARRARAAGDAVEVLEVPGDHYAVIDPDGPSWRSTLTWLDGRR